MPKHHISTRKRPVQRMNSARRQLEIVNAAFDCIATTGHLSLSTTELASRVGISQPAIFRHFRSKEQLHQAILDEANHRIIEELKLQIGRSEMWSNPVKLLQEVVVRMGDSFEREPGVWLTLICQRSIAVEADLDMDANPRGAERCAINQLSFALERMCVAAMKANHLSERVRPQDISSVVLSMLFGMGQLWLNNDRDFDLQLRLGRGVEGIVAGYILIKSDPVMPVPAIA